MDFWRAHSCEKRRHETVRSMNRVCNVFIELCFLFLLDLMIVSEMSSSTGTLTPLVQTIRLTYVMSASRHHEYRCR